MNETCKGIGGWDVPSSPCDYRKLEWEARQECETLREKLAELKQKPLRDGEKELLRRRTIRILTDIYYEQRSNIFLFQKRAEEREKQQKNAAGVKRSVPTPTAVSA